MKDDWRGQPYCDRKTAEFYLEPSKCNHPDILICQAKPCLKCNGSGAKTIAEDLKDHPFNHNAMRDRYLRRIAYSEAKKTHTFKTFYKTKSGEWTETEAEGDWKLLNPKYPNKVCDMRYESYFLINGIKITDWTEAAQAWIACQLFAEIIANPETYFPSNKCTACLYRPSDKLCMLSGKVRTIKSNTIACEQHFKSKELFYAD